MRDLFEKIVKDKILWEVMNLLFYGGGLIALLKLTVWFYSQKIFSFYYVYRNRSRFESHAVFKLIDELYLKNSIGVSVFDLTKKEILSDLFEIELIKVRQCLTMNLSRIIRPSLKEYFSGWGNFLSEKIVMNFYLDYIETKTTAEQMAKNRFLNSGMSHDDFIRLWSLYREITLDFELIIGEVLLRYRKHKDVYRVLTFILDDFRMLVEIKFKSLPSKFNRLNGRSYGIQYKGQAIGGKNAVRI